MALCGIVPPLSLSGNRLLWLASSPAAKRGRQLDSSKIVFLSQLNKEWYNRHGKCPIARWVKRLKVADAIGNVRGTADVLPAECSRTSKSQKRSD